MSFDIPGYFLDKKTNKLFKITSTGPYSLSELRKRLQKEEEEAKTAEAAAAKAALRSSIAKTTSFYNIRRQWPTNINQYLRYRAAFGSLKPAVDGMAFLMTLLKPRSSVQLDESNRQAYNNMCVEMTNDPDDYGEIFMATRTGLHHFGYEVDPRFHVWKVSDDYYNGNEVQALQLGRRTESGERSFRDLIGTTGNFIWRHAFPVLPPLLDEEVRQMFLTDDESSDPSRHRQPLGCPSSYVGFCESYRRGSFRQRKDLFWCFSLNDDFDVVVIGGDQSLYLLNNAFDLVHSRKVKSSVFAAHIPKTQPNICWTGSRNGKISLVDWRRNRSMPYYAERYLQSSSVVKLHSLEYNGRTGFELLAVGMDGSIQIWDTRKPKGYHRSFKEKHKRKDHHNYQHPIVSFHGHVNESHRALGFDLDLQNNLMMAAGSDGHVRIWSIRNSNSNEPIWTSYKYSSPIPAVKFMSNPQRYPRTQDGWTSVLPETVLSRHCPGALLFGANRESDDPCSIEWLTAVK
ncbi:MAG: WD40-repeat-containing domain protein [Benjaminiella poitrasii]|nr:MAG: WD40-repeat-containing domain protein [Benjaminiella poitrasii]